MTALNPTMTIAAEALPNHLYRSEAFAEDLLETPADVNESAWFSALWFVLPLAVALVGTASAVVA